MKFLQKFNSFGLLNEDRVVYITDVLDPEIRDTCFDILRDFNEENDSELKIEIDCVKVEKTNYGDFYVGLEDKDDLIAVACFSRIHNKAITAILRKRFFKHLVSYFTSLGYKNTQDRNYLDQFIFFYREKDDTSKKITESEEIYTNRKGIYNSDEIIDQEIIDTCKDIVRDFNEDNDTYFEFDLKSVYIGNELPSHFNGHNPNNRRSNRWNFTELVDREDIIKISIKLEYQINDFKNIQLLFDSLISYFTSLGYKNIQYKSLKGIIFFYK